MYTRRQKFKQTKLYWITGTCKTAIERTLCAFSGAISILDPLMKSFYSGPDLYLKNLSRRCFEYITGSFSKFQPTVRSRTTIWHAFFNKKDSPAIKLWNYWSVKYGYKLVFQSRMTRLKAIIIIFLPKNKGKKEEVKCVSFKHFKSLFW